LCAEDFNNSLPITAMAYWRDNPKIDLELRILQQELTTEVARHDIVVIGASGGGIEAPKAVVGTLPADLPAAVLLFCTSRRISESTAETPGPLGSASSHPTNRELIRNGHIFVAPLTTS
jgi:chemotaxis response regulator CheB